MELAKVYKITNIKNNKVYNLTGFCRMHKLEQSNMRAVANNKRKHCHGFTCARVGA